MAAIATHNYARTSPITSTSTTPSSFAPTLPTVGVAKRPIYVAPSPPLLHNAARQTTSKDGRNIRFAGAERSLGPTFSEEEDGDDSIFIDSQMAALGLDPKGQLYSASVPGHSTVNNTRSMLDGHAHIHTIEDNRGHYTQTANPWAPD